MARPDASLLAPSHCVVRRACLKREHWCQCVFTGTFGNSCGKWARDLRLSGQQVRLSGPLQPTREKRTPLALAVFVEGPEDPAALRRDVSGDRMLALDNKVLE